MARGWVVVGENNDICLTQMAGNLKPIISIPDKHLEIKHQKTCMVQIFHPVLPVSQFI
jgi:hypothetical protein